MRRAKLEAELMRPNGTEVDQQMWETVEEWVQACLMLGVAIDLKIDTTGKLIGFAGGIEALEAGPGGIISSG